MEPPVPAVIIPHRAGSPWVEQAEASARAEGAAVVLRVSEGDGASVRCPATAGFAERVEAGLVEAWSRGGETALLLNDDAVLEEGALAAVQRALVQAGVVGCTVWEWDRSGVQSAGIAVDRRTGRVRLLDTEPAAPIDDRTAVSGAALALRRDVWRRVGGFDRAYRFYMEDVAFCLAARDLGERVVIAADAVVRHRGGGTRSRKSRSAAWHLGRSHALLGWSMGGGALAQGLRLATIGAAGLAWSARDVGLLGPAAFVGGVAAAGAAAVRGEGARPLGRDFAASA